MLLQYSKQGLDRCASLVYSDKKLHSNNTLVNCFEQSRNAIITCPCNRDSSPSSFVSLSREQALGLLEEVFAGLRGIKGVHCCGNTDWSVLLSTSADILSLDAYDYAETLALYPEEVARYLERGGILAWGIVPSGPAAESETAESLVDRLERAIGMLVNKGVPEEALFEVGLVSPSCGLGSLAPGLAERVLELTAGVAAEMQRRYGAAQADQATQAALE